MKKGFYLIFLLVSMLIIPLSVFAEEEKDTANEDTDKAIVYFFRGEGCSHCAEAEAWFKEIEDEYGKYFVIKDYETWYDEDNADLMKQVAESRDESADGVPYILVGNKSWNGFADEYKDEIKSEIKKVYDTPKNERHDVLKNLSKEKKDTKKSSASDYITVIVLLIIVAGVGFGIYKARQTTE